MKREILTVIHNGERQGLKRYRLFELLQVSASRIRRWERRGEDLDDAKPGPRVALHRLLPEERTAVLAMSKDEQYVDDSHRVLAARGNDHLKFFVSASTVYSIMKESGLMTDRSNRSIRTGHSLKPEREEIDGSNQRWCWDISYLYTMVKGIFLFLYVLLDEYSRKVVAWRISWSLTHKEGQELIEEGMANERLTDEQMAVLELFNDRGVQMKAKPFMKMLEDLGIKQKFSRPRTPNDNPFIESHFSIVKGDPRYPVRFTDDIEGISYFTPYFLWYNNERLHGKIGYVTPAQRHNGEDLEIIKNREKRKIEAYKKRIMLNRINGSKKLLTGDIVLV
jgi:transposase InsO family protein